MVENNYVTHWNKIDKACIQGACVDSAIALTGTCLYGDDKLITLSYFGGTSTNNGYLYFVNWPPSTTQATCQQLLDYNQQLGIPSNVFCTNSQYAAFQGVCCSTCKSKID
jgi:hypothetical protein